MRAFVAGIILFLIGTVASAQWSSDPESHVPHFGVGGGIETVCSDGLGGVFYATSFSTDTRRVYMVHVNADGYLTLQNEQTPGIQMIDSARYCGYGLRLIPSEPPGTVIGIGPRYRLDSLDQTGWPAYVGMIFVKFDTSGFTGFGRVTINTSYMLPHRGPGGQWDYSGVWDGESDHQGGVHLMIAGGGTSYNHLSADGELAYPMPGIPSVGMYLDADGVGGVMSMEFDLPEHPDQMWGQRFDSQGNPAWGLDGRCVLDFPIYALRYNLGPNRILFRSRAPEGQRLFMLDTNAVNSWEPEGRLFRPGDTTIASLQPDCTGGFFCRSYTRTDSLTHIDRYDGDANLVSSAVPSRHELTQPDGLGGGYEYISRARPGQGSTGALWGWNSDLTPAWRDSTLVVQCATCGSNIWTPIEGGGVIGVIGSSDGIEFYHVNPDGSLGPRTSVARPRPPIDDDFRVLSVYPNPFNGETIIRFELPKTGEVSLTVHNISGQLVTRLTDGVLAAGYHEVMFDGRTLASGIYFYRLQSGEFTQTKKMVVLK